MWNFSQIFMYDLAATAIVFAFPFVALALMITQIEYHLAVMLGAVLIPFGIFGPTAFLTEFCIGWITGQYCCGSWSRRCWSGMGFPLFTTAVTALTAGGDPTTVQCDDCGLYQPALCRAHLVGPQQSLVDVWPGGARAQWGHGRQRGHGCWAGGDGRLSGRAWRLTHDCKGERHERHTAVSATTLPPATATRCRWTGRASPTMPSTAWSWRTRKSNAAIARPSSAPGARTASCSASASSFWCWPALSCGWWLTKQQVKAFVQTVQVTEEGRLVQLGMPQDLYAYTPPDGVYMEMVAQWVRWTRWRGDDERMTQRAVGLGLSAHVWDRP